MNGVIMVENTEQEKLRIGVFVCSCGKNIGGVVDVEEVVEYAKKIPDVELAMLNMYTCADPGQNQIKDAITISAINLAKIKGCKYY